MCGIAGFFFKGDFSNQEKAQWIRHAYNSILTRGRDATGFANISFESKDIHIFKTGKAWNNIKNEPVFSQEHWGDLVLLHTRAATHGVASDNANNHPHESEDWVMVHNGVIRNTKLKDYQYKGQCDSEVLLSYIQKFGLHSGVNQIVGSMAIALVNKSEPHVLYLYREGNPIVVQEKYMGKDKYIFAFSSLGLSWLDIRGKFFNVAVGSDLAKETIYKIDFKAEKMVQQIIQSQEEDLDAGESSEPDYYHYGNAEAARKKEKQYVLYKQGNWLKKAGIVYGD